MNRPAAPPIAAFALLAACLLTGSAHAQYTYNPAAADEAPGVRYFGSVKDDSGALLSDVSILIANQQLSYLIVTDAQGRFRVNVPLSMLPDETSFKCFKAGFQVERINKRPGPSAPKMTVQVDCVLRATTSPAAASHG